MTVIRNDCYRIEEVRGKKWLILPKGLKICITGEIRWRGKQGRLEIFYDDLTGRWYAHQSVEVDQPSATSLKTMPTFSISVIGTTLANLQVGSMYAYVSMPTCIPV